MSFRRTLSSSLAISLSLSISARAQQPTLHALPSIDRTGVHQALMVDGAPYLMLGAQMNNSSAWAASMPAVWEGMERVGVNTLEAPVYWETMEPKEGTYDFAQVDMLLAEARAHGKHLVLLWFGTWKNGSPGYVPGWVKADPRRFPLVRKADGTALFSLSPFGEESLQADSKAFAALMQHLKAKDEAHTVLMVQVENETGLWGGARDHSDAAEQLFRKPVPPAVLRAMGHPAGSAGWAETFGADADEYFSAWAIARYVEQVAAAGKRADPLPLYANAAVRDPIHPGGAGSFESGGPTYDVLPLWHAIAPTLDGLDPDIYMPDYEQFTGVLKQYALPWNAFFVPELGNAAPYARYFFVSLAQGAFGWSPFGMDTTGYVNYPLGAAKIDAETLAPFALNYAIATPMMRELAGWVRQGRVYASAEQGKVHQEDLAIAGAEAGQPSRWKAVVSYGQPSFYTDKPAPGNSKPVGEAMVVALGPDEFLVTGVQCRIDFVSLGKETHNAQRMWVTVEEGTYRNGTWVPSRLWNGDQTDYGLNFTDRAQVLRVRLAAY